MGRYLTIRFLLLILLLLFLHAYGWSQSQSASGVAQLSDSIPPPTELSELIVTAPSEDRSSVAVQQLSGEDLERMSALNVADAVKYFSGIQLKDYGGVGGVKTLDIRSLGSNHLGVFYDGVPLGNAQNGQVDLGRYSLDNIESISLYNGQKSARLVTAKDLSAASALYLRSRRPSFAGSRSFNLKATIRTGSFGLINPSINFDWKLSNALSINASGEYTRANGRYPFRLRGYFPDGSVAWDTTAVRRNGDVEALRAELSLFGRYMKGDYMAKMYFYDSERGIPGAIVNNVFKSSQRQWDRNIFFQSSWQGDVSERISLMSNLKYSNDYMRYLNPDTTQRYTDNRFRQNELYLSAAAAFSLRRGWSANVAFDWQYNTLGSSMMNFLFPRRHTIMGALSSKYGSGPLDLEAHLLFTHIDDTTHPSAPQSPGSNSRNAVSGGVSALWAALPGAGFRLRGFAKRSFRMPTFNDLYYTDIGNDRLNPEFVTQFDIGCDELIYFSSTVWEYFRGKLDLYHNRVKDKIIAVPKGNSQYRWMMMNIGRVRIYGVDLDMETAMTPSPGLSAGMRLTYTFQRAMDYSNPADCEDEYATFRGQIPYIPLHSATGGLFADWRGFSLNYSLMYVGHRWNSSSNVRRSYEPAWLTNDMTLSYRFQLRLFSELRVQLEINNLLDRQYEVIRNYPMPGRNWRITLSAALK